MKIKKTVLALLLVMSVVATVLPVTALGATYTTTTEYNLEDGTVTVTTELQDTTLNDEITYIVYDEDIDAESLTESNILYVDQITATGEGDEFSFQTTVDEFDTLGISTISLGSSATAPEDADNGNANSETFLSEPVSVTINGLAEADQSLVKTLDATPANLNTRRLGKGESVNFTVANPAGYKLSTVAVNGGAAVPAIGNSFTVTAADTAPSVVLTFAAAENGDVTIVDNIKAETGKATFAGNEVADSNYFISTGRVSIPSGDGATEYGILVTKGNTLEAASYNSAVIFNSNASYDGTEIFKFKALDNLNSAFSVKLIDTQKTFLTGDLNVASYIKYNESVTISDVKAVQW